MIYVIKNENGDQLTSHLPYGDYSYHILKDMEANGFKLYIDGKRAKFPTMAEWEKAKAQKA